MYPEFLRDSYECTLNVQYLCLSVFLTDNNFKCSFNSTAYSWLLLNPTFSSLICLYNLDPVVIIIMCVHVVSNIITTLHC